MGFKLHRMGALLACAIGMALAPTCLAAAGQAAGLAPYPIENFFVTEPVHAADGILTWWGQVHLPGDHWETGESRWNPRTGELQQRSLQIAGSIARHVDVGDDHVLLLGTDETAERALWVAADGTRREATLTLTRTHPTMLVLSDHSVLVLGGKAAGKRSNAVELLKLQDNKLLVERWPDIPGKPRASFSVLALADGRVLLFGGEEGGYIGCGPCTNASYCLDPAAKTWHAGPPLPLAMSDASATLLPDGQVLIAGGWTTEEGWGAGPTRATWLFDVASGQFAPGPPLPAPVAMHTALLLAGGNSAAIQAYDPQARQWRIVGEDCSGDEKGARIAFAFRLGERNYLGRVHSEGAVCADSHAWLSVAQMRLPAPEPAQQIDPEHGIVLYRQGVAFAPARAGGPALLAGGTIHGGMNEYLPTAGVDAVGTDGTIRALPALEHARTRARAVSLNDGNYLVLGGRAGKANTSPDAMDYPAPEWFSARSQRWMTMQALPQFDVLGQQADGDMLLFANGGALTRVRVVASGNSVPVFALSTLPKLKSGRIQDSAKSLQLLGTADGRIMVACGQVPMAAVKGETELTYARTREVDIFDPKQHGWHRSAPSLGTGTSCAMFDDGRVVQLGRDEQGAAIVEVSQADGSSWLRLAGTLPKVLLNVESARLFVLQGELFVLGKERGGGAASDSLQWYDPVRHRWDILWDMAPNDNWGAHKGRVVVRRLANGKRVVLPVAGPINSD